MKKQAMLLLLSSLMLGSCQNIFVSDSLNSSQDSTDSSDNQQESSSGTLEDSSSTVEDSSSSNTDVDKDIKVRTKRDMVNRNTYSYREGEIIDVEEYHDGRYGAKGEKRLKKEKPTEEQMRKVNALNKAKTVKGKPTAIIAKTIKGKGVSFMENIAEWHGKAPKEEEYNIAMDELKK